MWDSNGPEEADGTNKSPTFFKSIQNMVPMLAWVFEASEGLQVKRGSTSRASAYKSRLGLQILRGTTRQALKK